MRMAGTTDPFQPPQAGGLPPAGPAQAGGDFFDQMVKRRMPERRGPRRPPQAGTGARPRPDGGPVFGGAGGTRPMEPGPPQPGGLPPPPPIFQAPPPPAGGTRPMEPMKPAGGMPPPPIFQAPPMPQATGSSADVDLGPGFDAARQQRLKTAQARMTGSPSLRQY